MKTILQLCPRLDSGGIERGTVEIAEALKQSGFHSIVASGGGRYVDYLQQQGIEHITMPLFRKHPSAIIKNSHLLRKIVAEKNVDLMHARSRAPAWSAVIAKRRLQIPLVTGCHSMHNSGPMRLKRFYNRCVSLGDKVVVNSNCVAEYVKKEFKLASNKITVIHRGVDLHSFTERQEPKDIKLLTQLIATRKKIILMPGRITRWKGQHLLLSAVAKIPSDEKPIIVFAGRVDSENYQHELEALAQALSLTDSVYFLGDCPDIHSLYELADITVSASTEPEAFGRIAIEAQAAGSIMVASDLGGSRETIIPDETGFLIESGSVIALAEKLMQVFQLENGARNKIIQKAKDHIEKNFSKRAMCNKVIGVYQELLSCNKLI